jgi:hypothetical protein
MLMYRHRPNLPAGAGDGTLAFRRSPLPIEGCNPNQSCDLAAVEFGGWDPSQDRFGGAHEKLARPGWQQDCAGTRKHWRFSRPDVAIMIALKVGTRPCSGAAAGADAPWWPFTFTGASRARPEPISRIEVAGRAGEALSVGRG